MITDKLKAVTDYLDYQHPSTCGDLRLTAILLNLEQAGYKRGVREAAEVVGKESILQKEPTSWGLLRERHEAILALLNPTPKAACTHEWWFVDDRPESIGHWECHICGQRDMEREPPKS